MSKHNPPWPFVLGALAACATVFVPQSARAQNGQVPAHLPSVAQDASSHLSPPPRGLAPPLAQSLTPVQVDWFVQLIGEPLPVVWQHLLADPGLVPLAAAAADTRMARKSSGKIMTIAGFTILGVGAIAGYVIVLSAFSDHLNSCAYESGSCGNSSDGQIKLGIALMLVSTGVGLALGIPGIVRMAKQTDVETAAVDRYQFSGWVRPPVYPPWQSSAVSIAAPRKTLNLSLLSFTF